MVIRRGELWWADLPEPAGTRPVLIVSADDFNASRIATVIVVLLTASVARREAPGNVLLAPGDSGLPRPSVANVSTVTAIERKFLREPVSELRGALMGRVDDGLRLALGL